VEGSKRGGRDGGADGVDDSQPAAARVVEALPEGGGYAVLGQTGGPAANLDETRGWRVGLKLLLWESIILALPPPTCKAYTFAIPLHDHCAKYDTLPRPSVYMPYTIHFW